MAALRMLVKKRSSGVSAYIESLQGEELDVDSKTSSGKAKTLRSKLQDRRVTLNEAIEKENLFFQSSQRLAAITHDQKTKEQASLQKDFAESKIKTLQAELTKINSSLHAYQAKSAQGKQVPIIPLAMKTTTELSNMQAAFSGVIKEHYHTDPTTLEDSISRFSELRKSLQSVERSKSGIKLMFEYYDQLVLVTKRLLHPKLKHGVLFIWYDAISGLPAAQQSAVFERACVMFNIGALYSQLAAQVDRCSSEALDSAISLLENALGVFEYSKLKFTHSPMKDMTTEVLSLISDLMKAQAQEMLWEKEVLSGLNEDEMTNLVDYSHKTKTVADCYQPIHKDADSESMKDYIPDTWKSLIKIKEAHYKALSHYYAARLHQQIAAIHGNGGRVPEDIQTEIRFLYSSCPPEITSNLPKTHIGIVKSHVDCALLSHEYAIKFCNLCRDLHHIGCLTKMLSEAEVRTQALKEEMEELEEAKIIVPTIQSCKSSLSARLPKIGASRVEDLFAPLGPLPAFSGDNSWSVPRSILLLRTKGTMGFFIRGAQPVVVTGVDHNSPAEKAGMKVKDWILSVNDTDVKYKSHDEVVAMVKACKEEVCLEVTTPTPMTSSETESEEDT